MKVKKTQDGGTAKKSLADDGDCKEKDGDKSEEGGEQQAGGDGAGDDEKKSSHSDSEEMQMLNTTEDSTGEAAGSSREDASRRSVIVNDVTTSPANDDTAGGGDDTPSKATAVSNDNDDVCITKVGHDPLLRRLYLKRMRGVHATYNAAAAAVDGLLVPRPPGGTRGRPVQGRFGDDASGAILIDSDDDPLLEDDYNEDDIMEEDMDSLLEDMDEEGLDEVMLEEEEEGGEDKVEGRGDGVNSQAILHMDSSSDSSMDETENMYLKRRKMDRDRRYQAQKRRRMNTMIKATGAGGGVDAARFRGGGVGGVGPGGYMPGGGIAELAAARAAVSKLAMQFAGANALVSASQGHQMAFDGVASNLAHRGMHIGPSSQSYPFVRANVNNNNNNNGNPQLNSGDVILIDSDE